MYTALSQGILAFKLERICKFPQHMVLYRGISHPQNRTSVEMNCISRRFLLARTCPTHPTNLQSLGDKSIGAQQKIRLGILPSAKLSISLQGTQWASIVCMASCTGPWQEWARVAAFIWIPPYKHVQLTLLHRDNMYSNFYIFQMAPKQEKPILLCTWFTGAANGCMW